MAKEILWIMDEQEALRSAREKHFPILLDFFKEG
jgi:hypothetical protein